MHIPSVDSYKRTNPNIISEYVANMTLAIQTMYPHLKQEAIDARIKDIVKERIVRPVSTHIDHSSYGNAELVEKDLLSYTINEASNKVQTPSGTIYRTKEEQPSFIATMIEDEQGERSRVKSEMLDHEALGEVRMASIKNFIQSKIKIGVNAISGAMKSAGNCLYDPAGYNAITSICRHGAMVGYSSMEIMLTNNFYLPDEESIINWITVLLRNCPNEDVINKTVKEYNLHNPTWQEVRDNFYKSMLLYKFNIDEPEMIDTFISNIPQYQLTFVYYAVNLNRIFFTNSNTFRGYIKHLFDISNVTIDPSIDPNELHRLDEDLVIMVVSVYKDLLQGHILSDITKKAPDAARKIVAVCKHLQLKLYELQLLFDTFFVIDVEIPRINKQKELIRRAVSVSDTDSVIYTTMEWIEWFIGKIAFTDEAFQAHFFVTYFATKVFKHIYATMTVNMGATGKELRLIELKNELFCPVLLSSPIRKHYAFITLIKEGRWLPKPKLTTKGKNFRGSDLPKDAAKFTKNFVEDMLHSYMEHGELSGHELIYKVLQFEKDMMESIASGSTQYLGNTPINPAESYKNPESSTFFYYKLWNEVFEDKYDPIYPPQKVLKCVIKERLIKSDEYLNWLKNKNPSLHDRLKLFLTKFSTKKITRVLIPPHIAIPEEIIPILDIRAIVSQNMFGLSLILKSIGISVAFNNKIMLFSDIYSLDK